jgi:hypothetical protein
MGQFWFTTGDCDVGLREFGSVAQRRYRNRSRAIRNEAAGDRASHDAKPDDSNGLVHESSSDWSRREFEIARCGPSF